MATPIAGPIQADDSQRVSNSRSAGIGSLKNQFPSTNAAISNTAKATPIDEHVKAAITPRLMFILGFPSLD
jgi:hypothetical protein